MKQIALTQGKFAMVDDEDYEALSAYKWCATRVRSTRSYYAQRKVHLPDGRWRTVYMHRQILGIEHGSKRYADHADCATLNNTRSNLRIATPSENQRNQRRKASNTSGFKGVSYSRNAGKWAASIRADGKTRHLGYFDRPESAHEAYCIAARDLHKEFARTA